jgi:hypothetical protein
MKNKKILFEVTHPKHFHQFKNLAKLLEMDNEILFTARNKDVVLDLLEVSGYNYVVYDTFEKSIFNKLMVVPRILKFNFKVIKKFNPDYVLSRSSPYTTFLSRFMSFKSVIFPDSEVVKLTKYFVAPLSNLIVSPGSFEINYGRKHFRLDGLFEESYLSDKVFEPDKSVLKDIGVKEGEKFFLLRFVSWSAHHDVNQFGFNYEQKIKLIQTLNKFGKIIISSESKIEKEFEKYRFKLHPKQMHSVLYYAALYAGDSQSMATESALLGTTSLRFNSFVGSKDMSNFRILENKYNLLYNFNRPDILIDKAIEIIETGEFKQWKERKNSYFKHKPDLNQQTIEVLKAFFKV